MSHNLTPRESPGIHHVVFLALVLALSPSITAQGGFSNGGCPQVPALGPALRTQDVAVATTDGVWIIRRSLGSTWQQQARQIITAPGMFVDPSIEYVGWLSVDDPDPASGGPLWVNSFLLADQGVVWRLDVSDHPTDCISLLPSSISCSFPPQPGDPPCYPEPAPPQIIGVLGGQSSLEGVELVPATQRPWLLERTVSQGQMFATATRLLPFDWLGPVTPDYSIVLPGDPLGFCLDSANFPPGPIIALETGEIWRRDIHGGDQILASGIPWGASVGIDINQQAPGGQVIFASDGLPSTDGFARLLTSPGPQTTLGQTLDLNRTLDVTMSEIPIFRRPYDVEYDPDCGHAYFLVESTHPQGPFTNAQGGGLDIVRLTPGAPGTTQPTLITPVNSPITGSNGDIALVWSFDYYPSTAPVGNTCEVAGFTPRLDVGSQPVPICGQIVELVVSGVPPNSQVELGWSTDTATLSNYHLECEVAGGPVAQLDGWETVSPGSPFNFTMSADSSGVATFVVPVLCPTAGSMTQSTFWQAEVTYPAPSGVLARTNALLVDHSDAAFCPEGDVTLDDMYGGEEPPPPMPPGGGQMGG